MGIREREIRLHADSLEAPEDEAGMKELRAAERLAGDWSTAGGLYVWIFGLGVLFATWLKLE